MASAELTHAETARLAHQALRLRENGIDTERKVRDLAGRALADDEGADLDQRIGASTGHPLGAIALAVYNHTDADQPGPTAPDQVKRLMGVGNLGDIWKVWDDAVTANLEDTLDADALKAWRASVQHDQDAFDERVAQMEETGDWPVHPQFGHLRHLDGAANALYDLGREGFLDGTIQIPTPTIKLALVDSAVYTVNLATHQFMSSVASVVATSAAFTTKTKAAGVFDADDVVLTAVTGAQSEALIIYQSSAVGGGADVAATAQRLIGYIDTATGLPVTPNGGNITIAWDNTGNRIFKL